MQSSGNTRKRAVVTGASSGIGLAFAERLARERYDLLVIARRRDRLEQLADRLGSQYEISVEVSEADLTKSADLEYVEKRVAEDSRLELLVNNAGFGTVGRFHTLDIVAEEEEIRLNVLALVRLTRAALPGMIARNCGAVINVSSVVAFLPLPFIATYAATKAYVNSFTEAVHEELRGTGVRIQALCPGGTQTEFHRRAGIDTTGTRSLMMTPEDVVDASLAGLRRGNVICVPGLQNRAMTAIMRVMPRAVLRRLAGKYTGRLVVKARSDPTP